MTLVITRSALAANSPIVPPEPWSAINWLWTPATLAVWSAAGEKNTM